MSMEESIRKTNGGLADRVDAAFDRIDRLTRTSRRRLGFVRAIERIADELESMPDHDPDVVMGHGEVLMAPCEDCQKCEREGIAHRCRK